MSTRWRGAITWILFALTLSLVLVLTVSLLMYYVISIQTVTVGMPSPGNWQPYWTVWPPQSGTILQRVQRRGYLICGVGNGLTGFSELLEDGSYHGFDIDFCKAIAVAIFGDETKVEFKQLMAKSDDPSKDRFAALKNGEIDVLIRITTCNADRNTNKGFECGPIIFHDTQKFLVAADSGITDTASLNGKSVCVLGGTTNAENLTDIVARQDITVTPVSIVDSEDTDYGANSKLASKFREPGCDAITGNKSRLLGVQTILGGGREPISTTMIPTDTAAQISYEPLTPLIMAGDEQWHKIVNYAVYTTIYAAEQKIAQAKVGNCDGTSPAEKEYWWFLGIDKQDSNYFGQEFGLMPGFACRIIQKIGNYDEIYDKNLIDDENLSKYFRERTADDPNQIWQPGTRGRLYSPPLTPP